MQPNNWIKNVFSKNDAGKINKWWLLITIIVAFFVMVLVLGGGVMAFQMKYKNKFFPGTSVGTISLEGLTLGEAFDVLDQTTDDIERNGIKIIYNNDDSTNLNVMSTVSAISDPDLSRDIIRFNNIETIDAIMDYGRNGNWWQNLATQAKMLFGSHQFHAKYYLDEQELENLIITQFSEYDHPAQNAKPIITWQDGVPIIETTPESNGSVINYGAVIDQIKQNLKTLNNKPINIDAKTDIAQITLSEIKGKTNLIAEIIATSTPTLVYNKRTWDINKAEWGEMLEFQKNDGVIIAGINFDAFDQWLEINVASYINEEPRDASINFKDGRVTSFTTHRDGQAINLDLTYKTLSDNLLYNHTIAISTITTAPKILTEDINEMGIKEIIGTGESNFSGSPANRRHNIKVGAEMLNGVLIKPDEEFHLVEHLTPVDASSGYLPELVIKGNETLPEYGGGLCQVGTTIFRTALASGLPITERRQHAYNVSYYLEDGLPGIDATIYVPRPDVRFINDTGHYILIQSRIEGDYLYFDFWGTKDGRITEKTKPTTWGWIAPPATKYIETTELAVGTKKCTESAHYGVSASFDYNVTYPDGEVKKTTFTSKYKPWQAVCLIGVEQLSEDTATTTEDIL